MTWQSVPIMASASVTIGSMSKRRRLAELVSNMRWARWARWLLLLSPLGLSAQRHVEVGAQLVGPFGGQHVAQEEAALAMKLVHPGFNLLVACFFACEIFGTHFFLP